MRATAKNILTTALDEVGYVEKPVNVTKYNKQFGQQGIQWCQVFVWWVFKQNKAFFIKSGYTPTGVEWFKKNKQWHDKGNPQPGDVVYFDFPGDGIDRVSHVGICVTTRKNGEILTIEGNTSGNDSGDQRNGGMVAIKSRNREHIVGFGRPAYRIDEVASIVKEIRDKFKGVEVEPKTEERSIGNVAVMAQGVPGGDSGTADGGSDGLENHSDKLSGGTSAGDIEMA